MKNVEINDLEKAFTERLEKVRTQASHFIRKVPRPLRDVYDKAYDPEMVAIGPYHHHHGNEKLKMMEEVKLHYMKSLLGRKHEIPVHHYLSAIAQVEDKARSYYAEDIELDAAEFIEMLVLDGCFIIELIGGKIHNERTYPGLEYDLLLLENQIPFFVLRKLYELIEKPNEDESLIKKILGLYKNIFPENILDSPKKRSGETNHILDLVHTYWYPSSQPNTSGSDPSTNYIPSVVQLKDANVKFRVAEKSVHMLNIKFEDGVIIMPTLKIDDGTERLLRNLIAYEQFFPSEEPAPVSEYAKILDCLINSSKDVQILCQHGIIENHLSNDQAVADVVNRLSDKIIIYNNNFFYAGTFDHVNAHCKKPWNIAMAVFHRDYFNTPLAYISFFAAVVLLLLTIAQTIFAALQQFRS